MLYNLPELGAGGWLGEVIWAMPERKGFSHVRCSLIQPTDFFQSLQILDLKKNVLVDVKPSQPFSLFSYCEQRILQPARWHLLRFYTFFILLPPDFSLEIFLEIIARGADHVSPLHKLGLVGSESFNILSNQHIALHKLDISFINARQM